MRETCLETTGFWQAFFLLVLLSWSTCSSAQFNQRLHSSLQAAAPEKPYIVEVGIKIDQIVEIDQKSERFQVVGSIRMDWDEPKLAFDATDHGRDYKMYTLESFINHVDQQGILYPEFLIHNQQGRRFSQISGVTIFKDGHTIYFEEFTVTLQAPEFDFTQYPFDSQLFFLHLDSIMPIDYVRFAPLEGYSTLGDQLGEEEWVFNRHWTSIDEVVGVTGQQSSRFTFGIEANRHLNYYYIRIFLPLVIIILVSWFTFFLNDFSKRVDFAVANLLVFVAFNFTISNDIPRLGYTTFIDTVIFSSFVFAGFVVLVNVVFRRMEVHGRDTLARNIDKYTIWIYPFTLIIFVFVSWVWFMIE